MDDGTPIEIARRPAFAAELLIWLSPAFPTGGFAFSHGLERLVEAGSVTDAATLEDWLAALTHAGSLRNDLIVSACAHQAARDSNWRILDHVAELAAALQPSAERQLESLTQGRAFAATAEAAWPSASLDYLSQRHAGRIAYPVAVGAATGDRRIDLASALTAYAIAFTSNLVSAAIRLGVVGQFDGQRIIATLLTDIEAAASAARTATLDDLGGAMPVSDIASIEHETQYTRIFRS